MIDLDRVGIVAGGNAVEGGLEKILEGGLGESIGGYVVGGWCMHVLIPLAFTGRDLFCLFHGE